MKRRAETAGKLVKRCGHQNRGLLMLQRALCVEEVEEPVPEDGSADTAAVLGALKRFGQSGRCRQRCGQRAVAKETECLAVNAICTRSRGHVDCPRRGQLRREIHARLTELEFLDRACRNIRSDRAEKLVGNVGAIDFDASSAREPAGKGDRRVAAATGRCDSIGAVCDLEVR